MITIQRNFMIKTKKPGNIKPEIMVFKAGETYDVGDVYKPGKYVQFSDVPYLIEIGVAKEVDNGKVG